MTYADVRRHQHIFDIESCDLTPLDYYLWGVVKDKYYADKTETIDTLKDNIRKAIGEIQLHTNDNMLKNWIDCVGYYMARWGSHLNEVEGLNFQLKKINLRKYSVVFLKHFLKKNVFGGPNMNALDTLVSHVDWNRP